MEVYLKVTKEEDVLHIDIPENFDMNFFRELRKTYINTSHKKYVLDLKNTRQIISCSIGMLLQMHEYVSKNNSEIHIVNCDKQLKILLEAASIDRYFHISCK